MIIIIQFGLSMIDRLRSISRRFLYVSLLGIFRPLFSTVNAVKAPTKKLVTRAAPTVCSKPQPCKPITVISANLWHDWPRYRDLQPRLNAFAELTVSQAADIVLLQEVARTKKIWVDEWLSERLGMGYAYARANGHESGIGFEEGLAVFSRFPLETPRWQQLGASTCQFSRRLALGARVTTPCGNLMVFSVHLGILDRTNRIQINRLRDWIGVMAKEQTALIGGDFNAHENRSQIRNLQSDWLDLYRQIKPDHDGTTHELSWPWGKPMKRHRLDYLFMQEGGIQWNVLDAAHIGAPVDKGSHSDHLAVLARLVPDLPA